MEVVIMNSFYTSFAPKSIATFFILGLIPIAAGLEVSPSGEFALEFKGNGDYVETGFPTADLPETDQVTFEFWLRPTQSGFGTVVKGNVDGGDERWDITGGGGRIGWKNHGSRSTSLHASVTLNKWQHIAITYDGGAGHAAIYVDGELAATDEEQSAYTLRGSELVRFGREPGRTRNVSPPYFLLSDVRIWDGIRTSEEIRANMNEPLTGDEEDLVAWWPFRSGRGSEVIEAVEGDYAQLKGDVHWHPSPFSKNLDPRTLGVDEVDELTLGPVELRDPQGEVSYQWYRDGSPVEDAVESTFTLPDVTEKDLGTYYAEVRDEVGTERSESVTLQIMSVEDWPTYRANPRRGGSVSTSIEAGELEEIWRVELNKKVSQPVIAGGVLLAAEGDAHTIHAFDAESGEMLWRYIAGGRIDTPPTIYRDRVLFGAADGRVYCLRLKTGELIWRFTAAPAERRITVRDQFESAWPVHGSILVKEDTTSDGGKYIAYTIAGRSTYVDGGLWLYGLDPETGDVVHEARLEIERPDPHTDEGMAGYMEGAKSDILVSDGGDLYFFQERFSGDLTRRTDESPMQGKASERGGWRVYEPVPERESTGKRLITTGGFLDDTFNEGTYWTQGERWPGWDRRMGDVDYYGQLLVFDDRTVYGIHVMERNIRVRRGFTPGEDGYRLFALSHGGGRDRWSVRVPVLARGMVLTEDVLFLAGIPDVVPEDDPFGAFEGRKGGRLRAVSAGSGEKIIEIELDAPPVFDGLSAADGRLYMSGTDGSIICFGSKE